MDHEQHTVRLAYRQGRQRDPEHRGVRRIVSCLRGWSVKGALRSKEVSKSSLYICIFLG